MAPSSSCDRPIRCSGTEASNEVRSSSTSTSAAVISLANMPGRLIAMLDACHSGAAADGPQTGALTDDLTRDLLTDDYGVVVMSSSLGHQISLESGEHKAGFFTLGLVEGLAGKADFNADRVIHLHELDTYATLRVGQLTGGAQTPITGRPPTIRSIARVAVRLAREARCGGTGGSTVS